MSSPPSSPPHLDSPFDPPLALKGKGKARASGRTRHDEDHPSTVRHPSEVDEDRSPTLTPTQPAETKGKARDVSHAPAAEPVGLGFSFVDDSEDVSPPPQDSLELQRQSLEEIDDRQLALAMEISRLESELMDYEGAEGSSSTMSPEVRQLQELRALYEATVQAGEQVLSAWERQEEAPSIVTPLSGLLSTSPFDVTAPRHLTALDRPDSPLSSGGDSRPTTPRNPAPVLQHAIPLPEPADHSLYLWTTGEEEAMALDEPHFALAAVAHSERTERVRSNGWFASTDIGTRSPRITPPDNKRLNTASRRIRDHALLPTASSRGEAPAVSSFFYGQTPTESPAVQTPDNYQTAPLLEITITPPTPDYDTESIFAAAAQRARSLDKSKIRDGQAVLENFNNMLKMNSSTLQDRRESWQSRTRTVLLPAAVFDDFPDKRELIGPVSMMRSPKRQRKKDPDSDMVVDPPSNDNDPNFSPFDSPPGYTEHIEDVAKSPRRVSRDKDHADVPSTPSIRDLHSRMGGSFFDIDTPPTPSLYASPTFYIPDSDCPDTRPDDDDRLPPSSTPPRPHEQLLGTCEENGNSADVVADNEAQLSIFDDDIVWIASPTSPDRRKAPTEQLDLGMSAESNPPGTPESAQSVSQRTVPRSPDLTAAHLPATAHNAAVLRTPSASVRRVPSALPYTSSRSPSPSTPRLRHASSPSQAGVEQSAFDYYPSFDDYEPMKASSPKLLDPIRQNDPEWRPEHHWSAPTSPSTMGIPLLSPLSPARRIPVTVSSPPSPDQLLSTPSPRTAPRRSSSNLSRPRSPLAPPPSPTTSPRTSHKNSRRPLSPRVSPINAERLSSWTGHHTENRQSIHQNLAFALLSSSFGTRYQSYKPIDAGRELDHPPPYTAPPHRPRPSRSMLEGGHGPLVSDMGWTLGGAIVRALGRLRVVIMTTLLIVLYAGFVGWLTASGLFYD